MTNGEFNDLDMKDYFGFRSLHQDQPKIPPPTSTNLSFKMYSTVDKLV